MAAMTLTMGEASAVYPTRTGINPITPMMVERVARFLDENGVSEQTVAAMRERWSGIRFTFCSEDDVGLARPVLEQADFRIYLVNRSEHCLSLTNDFDNAGGVVVAEVYEE